MGDRRDRGVPGVEPVSRILVVDADEDVNRMLSLRLRARGYDVASVYAGAAAVEILDSRPPDLVFLDLALPDRSGLDVLGHVRSCEQDTAVIVMATFGSLDTAVGAMRNLADDYLHKPFHADELQRVIERTSERLQLTRQNAALRRRLERTNEELEAELARAATVQAQLLPDHVPEVPGFSLAGRCLPARKVGGDFYDWQASPALLTFTLCDVMGFGMPAALTMAEVRAVLRTLARGHEPGVALAEAESTLGPDLEHSGQFATAFLGRVDVATATVEYADAGHGHAFVRRADGTVDPPHARGFPLGVFPGGAFPDSTTRLGPGDALVVYSDGLVDGVPPRWQTPAALADELGGARTADDVIETLLGLVDTAEPQVDDLTIVALRRQEQ